MENENDDIKNQQIDDDSELDSQINAILSKNKSAEHAGSANPTETVIESNDDDESTDDTSTEDTSSKDVSPQNESQSSNESQGTDEFDFKQPTKGKFESEESYQLRLEIAERIKEKKTAKSEEERSEIQKEISELRKEFRFINNNRSQSFNRDSTDSDVQSRDETTQEKIEIDPQSLDKMVAEKVQSERVRIETESAITSFFDKYKDFKDNDVKQVFIDFFDSNYKIEGKNAKQVIQTLELARSAMFKPTESIQEKVIKSANVQQKVNAMQFPGGTIVRSGLNQEQEQSVKELMATGMSEDRARALILED